MPAETPLMTGSSSLPDPASRCGSSVVIYDGQCRICTGYVKKLAAWDWKGRLSYLSLHDPRVSQIAPGLTHDEMMRQMYVVDEHSNTYGGAAALRYLSRTLPVLWPAAPFLHLPGTLPIWNWGYQLVARRRYRFGKLDDCSDGACALHFGPPRSSDAATKHPPI